MNKYNESPWPCVHCDQPTYFGSGNFINRIPAGIDYELPDGTSEYRDGYACAKCMEMECDRCPEPIGLDEDVGVEQVYGEDTHRHEFDDGAWKVHLECLTATEQLFYAENNHEDES